jgi:hypothetical protein
LARTPEWKRQDGRTAADRGTPRLGWRRFAWPLWALAMVLLGLAALLMVGNRPASHDGFLQALLVPGFATVGAVVAARRGNTIGWLFLGVGLVAATGALCVEYALRARVTAPGSLPAGELAAWAAGWLFTLNFPAVGLLLLLFPDGRLPSLRWRPVAWGLSLSLGAWAVWQMVTPGLVDSVGPGFANPFGIDALPTSGPVNDLAGALVFLVVVVTLAAAVLAPFRRRRRAMAVERQQLKWLAFVAIAVPVMMGLTVAAFSLPPGLGSVPQMTLLLLLSVGIPAAVGVAVLRYRLYDIDRLISRVVVYVSLTGLLALSYAAGVLVLGTLVGRAQSGLTVAGATLACAALFQPLRGRLQHAVDRRFNRRRHDAARTIEQFSGRLRAQVDLDTLTADLLTVAEQTMEPTRVSLWLRAPAFTRAGGSNILDK